MKAEKKLLDIEAFHIQSGRKNSILNPPSPIPMKLCVFYSYYVDIINGKIFFAPR